MVNKQIAGMFRRGDRDCIKGDSRTGLVTERKDEVSTLGPIHLDEKEVL
jgi:hypothetical protein